MSSKNQHGIISRNVSLTPNCSLVYMVHTLKLFMDFDLTVL